MILYSLFSALACRYTHNTGSKSDDFGTPRELERNNQVSHLVQRRLARGHELVEDAVLLGGVVRVTRRRARLKKVRYEW